MDEKIPELTLTPDLTAAPEVELVVPEEPKPAPEAGPDLSALTPAEQKAVLDFADKIGIEKGFVQEGEAVSDSFIPNWDLEGF